MSVIWTPSRKIIRQPQGSFDLDFSSPLVDGLIAGAVPGSELDVFGRGFESLGAKDSIITGPAGRAWKGSGSPSQYVTLPTYDFSEPFTLFRLGNVPASSSDTYGGLVSDIGTGGTFFVFGTTQNRLFLRENNIGGGVSRIFGSNETTKTNQMVPVAAVLRSGDPNDIDVYWDGRLDNGSVITGSNGPVTTWNRWSWHGAPRGSFPGSAATSAVTSISLAYRRPLDAGEIYRLSVNPWQIFRASHRTIFLPAATTTITASGAGVRQLIGNQYMAVAASRLNGVLQ